MHPNIFRYISTYILSCTESKIKKKKKKSKKKGRKRPLNYENIANA